MLSEHDDEEEQIIKETKETVIPKKLIRKKKEIKETIINKITDKNKLYF